MHRVGVTEGEPLYLPAGARSDTREKQQGGERHEDRNYTGGPGSRKVRVSLRSSNKVQGPAEGPEVQNGEEGTDDMQNIMTEKK